MPEDDLTDEMYQRLMSKGPVHSELAEDNIDAIFAEDEPEELPVPLPQPLDIALGALAEQQALAVEQRSAGKGPGLSAVQQLAMTHNYIQATQLAMPAPWQAPKGFRFNTPATQAQDHAEQTKCLVARAGALGRIMHPILSELLNASDVQGRGAKITSALAAIMATPDLPNAMVCFFASALATSAGDEFSEQVRTLFTVPGAGIAAALDAMGEPEITRPILLTRLELMQELGLEHAHEIAILDEAMMTLAKSRVEDKRANGCYRQMGHTPAGIKAYTALADASRTAGQTSAALIEGLRNRRRPQVASDVTVFADSGAAVMIAPQPQRTESGKSRRGRRKVKCQKTRC